MRSCFAVTQPSMSHFRNRASPFAFHWTYFKVRRVWKYTTNLHCEAEVGRVTLFMAVWNPPDLISHRITHTFSNKLLNKCAHFVCTKLWSFWFLCYLCHAAMHFAPVIHFFFFLVMWGFKHSKGQTQIPTYTLHTFVHLLPHAPSHSKEKRERLADPSFNSTTLNYTPIFLREFAQKSLYHSSLGHKLIWSG